MNANGNCPSSVANFDIKNGFGDKVGRKETPVAALLTMGISIVIIGILTTYASIDWISALLLTLCRFGHGRTWRGNGPALYYLLWKMRLLIKKVGMPCFHNLVL